MPGSRAWTSSPPRASPACSPRSTTARRPRSAIYFMYDVKQYDPKEWSSPPLEGRIVDRPGVGKIMVGRGTTNTKGPQMALPGRAARVQGRQAEAADQHRARLRRRGGDRLAELQRDRVQARGRGRAPQERGHHHPAGQSVARRMPSRSTSAPRASSSSSSCPAGEKWGRGPNADIHSSLAAHIDSPAWRLVQALNTLVKADGHTPAVEGFFDDVEAAQSAVDARFSRRRFRAATRRRPRRRSASSTGSRTNRGTTRWCGSSSQPTINIEGLVGGYTGPGGKTILPHTRRREDRHAARAGHDRQGHAGEAQGAPREARLRRHRGEHDRRLRSDRDAAGLAARGGDGADLHASRASIRCCGRGWPGRGPA